MMVLGGLIWSIYRFSQYNLGGEGFSIQWISIQALASDGTDPYSNEVTSQIRAMVPRENAFVTDAFPKYTSPLFSGIVIFPVTLIKNRTLAHTVWMIAQLLSIFAMILLCIRLTGWRPPWYSFAIFLVFTIFSFHVLTPWLDGGLSIWSALFILLALVTINANRNEVGGVFLALSMIQPQMVILPIILILIWCITKKRVVILLWFFITLILLSVIGLFLVPNWIIDYIRLIYRFSENFPPGNPRLFFADTWPGLAKLLGWLLSGVTIVLMLFEWLLVMKKDVRWLLWTVCLTMVLEQWIGIPTIPSHFIELIIPLILIPAMLAERWPLGGQWAAVLMAIVLFAWEWTWFFLDFTGSHPPLLINLIFPIPTILIIGLYWVRWWAIKPRRLLIEELHLSETY
jgi:Glycosyltransferase family 87